MRRGEKLLLLVAGVTLLGLSWELASMLPDPVDAVLVFGLSALGGMLAGAWMVNL